MHAHKRSSCNASSKIESLQQRWLNLHRTRGRIGVRGIESAPKRQSPADVSLLPEAKIKYEIVFGQFHS